MMIHVLYIQIAEHPCIFQSIKLKIWMDENPANKYTFRLV